MKRCLFVRAGAAGGFRVIDAGNIKKCQVVFFLEIFRAEECFDFDMCWFGLMMDFE